MPAQPRTIAIGDIHGCLRALDALLAVIDLREGDRLVTLGDYVDRGPRSRDVLERVISFYDRGGLVAIRGNHELMMLRSRGALDEERFWLACGGLETLASYAPRERPGRLNDVPDRHWRFLAAECENWFETETHIFVHAGVEPQITLEDQDEDSLFWRPLADRGPHDSGKIVVCGHSEQRSGVPLDLEHTICIDTLAYGGGWLTGLDVVSGKYWQANDNGETRRSALS